MTLTLTLILTPTLLLGIATSSKTQMLAPGALPLTVIDWADVDVRNATCELVRRCDAVSPPHGIQTM